MTLCVHALNYADCPGCQEAADAKWRASGGVRNLIFGERSRYSSRVWDSNDDGTWKELGAS